MLLRRRRPPSAHQTTRRPHPHPALVRARWPHLPSARMVKTGGGGRARGPCWSCGCLCSLSALHTSRRPHPLSSSVPTTSIRLPIRSRKNPGPCRSHAPPRTRTGSSATTTTTTFPPAHNSARRRRPLPPPPTSTTQLQQPAAIRSVRWHRRRTIRRLCSTGSSATPPSTTARNIAIPSLFHHHRQPTPNSQEPFAPCAGDVAWPSAVPGALSRLLPHVPGRAAAQPAIPGRNVGRHALRHSRHAGLCAPGLADRG